MRPTNNNKPGHGPVSSYAPPMRSPSVMIGVAVGAVAVVALVAALLLR
jgi:hypothetical protein